MVTSNLVPRVLSFPLRERLGNEMNQKINVNKVPLTCPLRLSSCSTSRSRSPCPSSICRFKLSKRFWSLFRADSFSSTFPWASSSFLDRSVLSASARENCWRNCSAFREDWKRWMSIWHEPEKSRILIPWNEVVGWNRYKGTRQARMVVSIYQI